MTPAINSFWNGETSMNMTRLVGTLAVCIWFSACVPTQAADSEAGQKTFQSSCAACHKLKTYAGKSDAELETQIRGIIAGTIKHPKKLTLNDSDVVNVAAYISSNEPK